MRTPEEIRLEIIGLYLDRKKYGVEKYQNKANGVLESYAKQHAIEFALANVYGTDCTKIDEDAFGMREVYERDYTEWITPK